MIATKKLRLVGLFLLLVFARYEIGQQAAVPQSSAAESGDVASMDLESLMNVEVTTASRFSDKLFTAPSIMSVVTSDELRRFGGLTLNEILPRVAGMTGSTIYFVDRSLVAARGDQTKINGGHILFLINGRPKQSG